MKKILKTFVVIFSILAISLLGFMFTKITEDSKVSNRKNLSVQKDDDLITNNFNWNNDGTNENHRNNNNSYNNNSYTNLGNTITNFVNDILNSVDLSDINTNVTYNGNTSSGGVFDVSSKLVNTQTLTIDDINAISIEYNFFDVTFYPSETNELVIMEYMNYTPSENELAQITKKSDTLIIKSGRKNNFGTTILPGNNKVDIYLPTEYKGNLTTATTSGNIRSNLILSLEQFIAASTSGNIYFNEITAKNITIATTSGSIGIDKSEGTRNIATNSGSITIYNGSGTTNVTATSGNITIENTTGIIDAQTTSGSINIDALSVGGNLSTTSGSINLRLADDIDSSFIHNINLTATSGSINLILPANLSYNFKANTNSGSIRTSFDKELTFNKKGNNATGTIGNDPRIDIKIATTSGSVYVDN